MQKNSKPRSALKTLLTSNRSSSVKSKENKSRCDKSYENVSLSKENNNDISKKLSAHPKKPSLLGLPPILSTERVELEKAKIPNLDSKKFLDVKRWYCIPRPQYSKACGITSLVGCWNYLFSVLGNGKLPYITPKSALKILGFEQEITKINFGTFTGNPMIIKWFEQLCEFFDVKGKAKIYWKKDGPNENPEKVMRTYLNDVQNSKKAFIYHCHNHYFTPIGYDIVPLDPEKAYIEINDKELEESEMWVIIGETSKKQPGMHVFKWKDIVNDIQCIDTHYYNIREKYKGMQLKRDKTKNNHCFILLEAL